MGKQKVFHNLDDFEKGKEYELQLKDEPLIKNNKLNKQNDTLLNERLYKLQKFQHIKQKLRNRHDQIIDDYHNLNAMNNEQNILSEYDNFEQTKKGYFLDEQLDKQNEEKQTKSQKLNINNIILKNDKTQNPTEIQIKKKTQRKVQKANFDFLNTSKFNKPKEKTIKKQHNIVVEKQSKLLNIDDIINEKNTTTNETQTLQQKNFYEIPIVKVDDNLQKNHTKNGVENGINYEENFKQFNESKDQQFSQKSSVENNELSNQPEEYVEDLFEYNTLAAINYLRKEGLIRKKPKNEINIEHRDKRGKVMDPKTAFKQFCWKFHGVKPTSKKLKKIEKKMKQKIDKRNN